MVMFRSESANQLFDEDDLSKQKNQRMATLLGFSTDPSREALMQELVKKGILAQVSLCVFAEGENNTAVHVV